MKEIERKFLVNMEKLWGTTPEKTTDIEQGYLTKDDKKTIRIRIENEKGYITVKGKTTGITRDEFEYEISLDDAKQMIKMCDKTLSKRRSYIQYKGKLWTVDVFSGENDGLVVAEIELQSEDEEFETPDWAIKEVNENKYNNSNLIDNPYKNW